MRRAIGETWWLLLGMSLALLPAAAYADGATTFKDKCVDCHGDKGQGLPNLAPALKGNDWVKGASLDAIKTTIKDGRTGSAKRHPNIPAGMPGQPIYDEELDEIAKYVKQDLQK